MKDGAMLPLAGARQGNSLRRSARCVFQANPRGTMKGPADVLGGKRTDSVFALFLLPSQHIYFRNQQSVGWFVTLS